MKEITGKWLIEQWDIMWGKNKLGTFNELADRINQFFHEPELSDEERSQEIMKESVCHQDNSMTVMIGLQALITEREGMIAENKQRERLEQSMAYSDDCFNILAEKICKLAEQPTKVIEGWTYPEWMEMFQTKDQSFRWRAKPSQIYYKTPRPKRNEYTKVKLTIYPKKVVISEMEE